MNFRSLFFLIGISASLMIPAHAQDRAIAFLFGPAPAEAGQKAAAEAAGAIHQWLQSTGTAVEVRRPGTREAQEVLKFMQPPAVQQVLSDAAKAGNNAQLDAFLDALEMTSSALGRKPGARFLIAVLELPASNTDLAYRLKQIGEACRSSKVQVLLWDLASSPAADLTAWQSLATGTGRALPEIVALLPSTAPAPATLATRPATAPPPATGPTIYTGFWQSAPASSRTGATVGPMTGLVLSEVPAASVKFVTDKSNAMARVRITQVVKKGSEVTWQASREFTVKSAANRLEERKKGSICFARRLTLPAGQYTIESTVEDLNGEEKSVATMPLTATDTAPGLSLSGTLFVRKLERRMDSLEGDDLIQYDGTALTPMLQPSFPANQPFELPVYFLIYPDMNGKRPRMRLDILQNGQLVGGTDLAFTEKLRDDTREGGGGSGTGGEQHREIPYLAKLQNAMLLAGHYEVRITVNQDSQQVVRSLPFRVVEAGK